VLCVCVPFGHFSTIFHLSCGWLVDFDLMMCGKLVDLTNLPPLSQYIFIVPSHLWTGIGGGGCQCQQNFRLLGFVESSLITSAHIFVGEWWEISRNFALI
jgi:hypothetical protein